ncbi:hypothetical protein GWI33_007002 [Rhynchophorus ferrugineus]|uniref:Uncharacterized protein n=1 Tax=Rhynchophorus ferrugineus TaxID=354439 RepID=A0A834IKE0_RHYFE|nr:hypothetical protein GWI33_007002 [Rhynchophorus ferrugineus]
MNHRTTRYDIDRTVKTRNLMEYTSNLPLVDKVSFAKFLPLILVLVQPVISAPTLETELWINPCSNHQIRQVRSTAEKELNFFITTLNKDMFMELKSLYPQNVGKMKSNCPRFNKLIDPIKGAANITIAHENFYKSMIEFAMFLDRLKNIPINTNTQFDLEKRRSIYEKTQNNLKLTICEFNETIMKQLKGPNMLTQKPPRVKTTCLPKQADLSHIQMLDMQFFDKLRRFFKLGKKNLKLIKRRGKGSSKAKSGQKHRTKAASV